MICGPATITIARGSKAAKLTPAGSHIEATSNLAYRFELKYGFQLKFKIPCPASGQGTSQEAQVKESRSAERVFDRMGRTTFFLVSVVAAGLCAPSFGQAAYTPADLYDCQPRSPKAADPPPKPDLPPAVERVLEKAIAADDFQRPCPVGEVPHPTGYMSIGDGVSGEAMPRRARTPRGNRRRHGHRQLVASASRQSYSGYWYSWATGKQFFSGSKGVNGLWAIQTNEQPYIPYNESTAGAHSLAQLWAVRETQSGCWSTAETGWRETATYGDVYPHLFVAAFDCGVFRGYAGKGLPWVQSSGVVFPGSVLSHNDAFHVYGARMDGNNWWIYYDGQWVGYIPHSVWTSLFPSVLTETEVGGEVATPSYATCADMGYAGLFGTNGGAAMFSDVWYEYDYNTKASSSYMAKWASDPSYYVTGHWDAGYPGSEFRYGGPGWC
jgi:hypothetical protein